MSKSELENYILKALFNTSFKDIPKYVIALQPELFAIDNRGMFQALIEGEKDLRELTSKSGWRASRVVGQFTTGEDNYFLSEQLVKDFKSVCLKQDAEKALLENNWEKLTSIANQIQDTPVKGPMELYRDYKEQFREIANSGLLGVTTGIKPLDEATKGLIPGHIWVCGAYYGHGKTYFAINLINSLISNGKRCLFISLEMPPEEIVQRFISLRAKIGLIETVADIDAVKGLARDGAEKSMDEYLNEGKLIIDSDSRNINTVLSTILRENFRKHIDLIVIDYIQLMAEQEKQYEAISQAVQKLQGLAKKIKSTVLLLSQVNNASQQMGDNRNVDGFKGAGDIGQVANVAIRIERDRDATTNEFGNRFGLRITKIRHGQPTKLDMIINFPGGEIRPPMVGEISMVEQLKSKKDYIYNTFASLGD